jgi:hypothetical protein
MVLNCREVTRHISSDGLMRVGWIYRLRVEFHVILCRECRRYKKQIHAIGVAARSLWPPRKDEDETLDRLQDRILSRVRPSINDDEK